MNALGISSRLACDGLGSARAGELVSVTDETEAAGTLLSMYKRLGLGNRLGQGASTCTVKFRVLPKNRGNRYSWRVEDSVLKVKMMDTDIDAGTMSVISDFVKESVRRDPGFRVPTLNAPVFVAFVLSLVLLIFSLSLQVFQWGSLVASNPFISVLIVGLFVADVLLFLFGEARVAKIMIRVFVERMMKVTSLNEEHVFNEYADLIVPTPLRNLMRIEACIWVLSLIILILVLLPFL